MKTLASHPNMNTAPAGLRRLVKGAEVRGYQSYCIWPSGARLGSGTPVTSDKRLVGRERLLGPLKFLGGKSVLDLGANGGYWSLLARSMGATPRAWEMDPDYVEILLALDIPVDIEPQPADVVFAFALVHWLYDCTEHFGDIKSIVEWLAELAKEALLVEWVAPEDPVILKHGHLGDSPELYTYERFQTGLQENFRRIEKLGDYTPTRSLWRADK